MSDVPTLKEISRTLKEISSSLKEQNRILKAAHSLPSQPPKPPEPDPITVPPLTDPDTPKPRTLGWSTAGLYQREGTLIVGDIKTELDDSQWVWVGEAWERFEAPSAG